MFIDIVHQKIRVDVVAENIFRIRRDLSGAFEDASLIVKNRAPYTQGVEEGENRLKAFGYTLCIAENGAVTIENAAGTCIYCEKECVLHPTNLKPDPKTIPDQLREKIGDQIFSCDLKLNLLRDEVIMGLGNHRLGSVNMRGLFVPLVQYNLHQPVPVLMSSRGYSILMDECCIQYFDDRDGKAVWHIDASSCVDYYVILGEGCDQLIRGYRSLVGETALFPKALFGYIQSKERYKSQQELLEIAAKYRELRVPLDVVVQDWMYWDENGENWGEKSFCEERYPNPQAMVDELHRENLSTMISIWPKLGKNAPNAADFMGECELLPGGYYNVAREDCKDIYYRQLYDGILKYGFDILWTDDTEPLEPELELHLKEEPSGEELVDIMRRAYKDFCDPRFTNAYVLLHNGGLHSRMQHDFPHERKMMLTRASYAGLNASAAVGWTGDIRSSFEELKVQIPSMLNHSMAGEAYDHFDIGGFFPQYQKVYKRSGGDYRFGSLFKNRAYAEFYVRSLELATFLPIMRSHGTGVPREIWRFGKEGERFYDAIEKNIRLRYRLMPYLYSMNYQVSALGKSMLYPLCAKFSDPEAARENTNYMFGEELLVCPVLRHMYYQAPKGGRILNPHTIEEVYLPEGNKWYQFGTEHQFSGGRHICVNAPLDTIPVFVRAGSILPLNKTEVQSSCDVSPLEVCVYPGADGTFIYYNDDGRTDAYRSGAYIRLEFSYDESARELTVFGKISGEAFEFFVKNMETHRSQLVRFTGGTRTVRV